MRITVGVATVEVILVFIWIASFIHGGVIGSPHQYWYAEVPIAFLAMPILASGVAIKIRSCVGEWRFGVYFLLILLLAANLIAFFVYALMSGGGV
jgi:hypothetical protein